MGILTHGRKFWADWRNQKRFNTELYTISGKPEDCLQVAEALEWLCSPAANGLGLQLLMRANRIHGCRVFINASADTNACDSSRVSLNLAVHGASEGALQHIAATIAHELTHAADPKPRIRPPMKSGEKWGNPLEILRDHCITQ